MRPNEEWADTFAHPWHSPRCYEGGAHRDESLCTCGLTALRREVARTHADVYALAADQALREDALRTENARLNALIESVQRESERLRAVDAQSLRDWAGIRTENARMREALLSITNLVRYQETSPFTVWEVGAWVGKIASAALGKEPT